jgi:diguanylate cyclase (GGDEF)-like protein
VSDLVWSKLPDLAAVALLTYAFASVARQNHSQSSKLWLTAWLMIVLHFVASLFISLPGNWGGLALFVFLVTLAWAGELFMWSTVPYRKHHSSPLLPALLLLVNTLYIALAVCGPAVSWALTPAAALYGIVPLALFIAALRGFSHPLRWTTAALYTCLTAFLLLFQHRSGNGNYLALNAIFFVAYFACGIHSWYTYRRATAGAFITISGFFLWAAVFFVAPLMKCFQPQVQIENEVWSLPKYLVATGMILLLLEKQIEHNKYLALHDELTGLPNRRLFLDRLSSSMERARRTRTQTALLVVDLDGFKNVNDTLGHHAGDQLLQHVAKVFTDRIRRSDTVARTGGDEFSVILNEPTSREDAHRVGVSLMRLLNERIQMRDYQVRVGASVGTAIFPDDAENLEDLCIAADLRMYESKHETARANKPRNLERLPATPSLDAKAREVVCAARTKPLKVAGGVNL